MSPETPAERITRLEERSAAKEQRLGSLEAKLDRLFWVVIAYGLTSGVFQYLQAGAPGVGKAQGAVVSVGRPVLALVGLA